MVVWDGKNFKDIYNPPVRVTATFQTPLVSAAILTMNADGSYSERKALVEGAAGHQTLNLEAPDSVMLIRINRPPKSKI